jgi:hypothetical protein
MVKDKKISTGRRKSDSASAGPFWPRLRCSLLTDRCGYARRSRLAWTKKSSAATLSDLPLAVLTDRLRSEVVAIAKGGTSRVGPKRGRVRALQMPGAGKRGQA